MIKFNPYFFSIVSLVLIITSCSETTQNPKERVVPKKKVEKETLKVNLEDDFEEDDKLFLNFYQGMTPEQFTKHLNILLEKGELKTLAPNSTTFLEMEKDAIRLGLADDSVISNWHIRSDYRFRSEYRPLGTNTKIIFQFSFNGENFYAELVPYFELFSDPLERLTKKPKLIQITLKTPVFTYELIQRENTFTMEIIRDLYMQNLLSLYSTKYGQPTVNKKNDLISNEEVFWYEFKNKVNRIIISEVNDIYRTVTVSYQSNKQIKEERINKMRLDKQDVKKQAETLDKI